VLYLDEKVNGLNLHSRNLQQFAHQHVMQHQQFLVICTLWLYSRSFFLNSKSWLVEVTTYLQRCCTKLKNFYLFTEMLHKIEKFRYGNRVFHYFEICCHKERISTFVLLISLRYSEWKNFINSIFITSIRYCEKCIDFVQTTWKIIFSLEICPCNEIFSDYFVFI